MTSTSFDAACVETLHALEAAVPMGSWSVIRRAGQVQVHLRVLDDVYGLHDGDATDWAGSLCRRMIAGAPPVLVGERGPGEVSPPGSC